MTHIMLERINREHLALQIFHFKDIYFSFTFILTYIYYKLIFKNTNDLALLNVYLLLILKLMSIFHTINYNVDDA